MIDRYTKIVLTVIAVALSAIAIQGTIGAAQAQLGDGCGSSPTRACYVQTGGIIGLDVTVTNWPR